MIVIMIGILNMETRKETIKMIKKDQMIHTIVIQRPVQLCISIEANIQYRQLKDQ